MSLLMAVRSRAPRSRVSLLRFNGANGSTSFIDDTGKVWTRAGLAEISTAQSKFGGSSGRFPGGTDYIGSAISSDFNVGAGDFTMQCWHFPVGASGAHPRVFEITQSSNGAFTTGSFGVMDRGLAGGAYGFFSHEMNSTGNLIFTTTASVVDNAWVHLALVRHGNVITLYVNGTASGSASTSLALTNADAYCWVGGQPTSADATMNGFADDFAVDKGVALYTANFTPPAVELTL